MKYRPILPGTHTENSQNNDNNDSLSSIPKYGPTDNSILRGYMSKTHVDIIADHLQVSIPRGHINIGSELDPAISMSETVVTSG